LQVLSLRLNTYLAIAVSVHIVIGTKDEFLQVKTECREWPEQCQTGIHTVVTPLVE